MADVPKIGSKGLLLAAKEGHDRISSVAHIKKETMPTNPQSQEQTMSDVPIKHGSRILIPATYVAPTGADAPSSWVILLGNDWNTAVDTGVIIPCDGDQLATSALDAKDAEIARRTEVEFNARLECDKLRALLAEAMKALEVFANPYRRSS